MQGAGRAPQRRAMPCLAGKALATGQAFLLRSGGSGAPRQPPCREMSTVAVHSTGIQRSEGSGIRNVGSGEWGSVTWRARTLTQVLNPTDSATTPPLIDLAPKQSDREQQPTLRLVGLTCRYSSSSSTLPLSATQLAQGVNGEAARTPAGESKATTLESCLEPCRVPERTTNPRWGVRIQSPRPRVCRHTAHGGNRITLNGDGRKDG